MVGYSGGGGRGRVPLNNRSGASMGLSPQNLWYFVSTLSRLFSVCVSCYGNLQPSPNPLARFKWAARRGGPRGRQHSEGRREKEGKKAKGRDGKRRSNLGSSKKILRAPTLQFITKLVYRLDGKLLVKMGSSFRISLHLYSILLLQIFFTQS